LFNGHKEGPAGSFKEAWDEMSAMVTEPDYCEGLESGSETEP